MVADDSATVAVETTREYGEVRLHLHQAVIYDRELWVVIALRPDGVRLAQPDDDDEWYVVDLYDGDVKRGVTPLVRGGVPVWGY